MPRIQHGDEMHRDAGGGGHAHAWNEVPAGTIDGANDTFTLTATPNAASEQLYKNGIRQREGSGNDYLITADTITFEAGAIPQTGDSLLADYETP